MGASLYEVSFSKINLILNLGNITSYKKKHPFVGSTCGRYANRISKAQFYIKGKKFNLVKNEKSNTLHGGKKGFDKIIWKIHYHSKEKINTHSYKTFMVMEKKLLKYIMNPSFFLTLFTGIVLVVTTEQIPNKTIIETLGIARGSTVRARNIGKDIFAGLKNIIGGEISEYTKLQAQSREQALKRMVDDAESLGANAIVNVRFTTSMVMQGASEILAYGTAVKIQE